MASSNPSFPRFRVAWLAYAAAAGVFLWICAQFYLPGQGFTYLVMFGEKQADRYLPELRASNYYEQKDSYGYDAQYYAQIAMHPRLGDPELRTAVDSLPYRARRILFCWTAYAFGGGSAWRALQVYAVQNIAAWLLLGWVLLRWFPPGGLENFLRWFAVMFTFGLCFSVRGSLVDGPSLLLIAWAMALLETGRTWWSAALLGVAGLGKETNILAAAIHAPADWRSGRGWLRAIGRGALIVAPLALWLVGLKLWLGTGGDAGARNFDWPFAAYWRKWHEALALLSAHPSSVIGRAEAFVMAAMTAQWLFFALRPRWKDAWWRLGASYAVLMVVLGDAVWEGYPGAAPRVLLPMTLAFNVALPRGRRWWALLLLGNLLVWPSADTLVPPGREDSEVLGAHDLKVEMAAHDQFSVRFPPSQWYGIERSYFEYWRWSRGSATVVFHNPHPHPITAAVRFRLKSADERKVILRSADRELWSGGTGSEMQEVDLPGVTLPPGDTVWRFDTDKPAMTPPNGDPRAVAFRICDFRVELSR